ncbi:hypothetical protein BASA62_006837 [Batrachochytrium salamandrivorans]|nr:hypothetical protein BASA62_006837 [Batrachochytrium salamandrivorans]
MTTSSQDGQGFGRKSWLIRMDDMAETVVNYNTHERVTAFDHMADFLSDWLQYTTLNPRTFEGHMDLVMAKKVALKPKDSNTCASGSDGSSVKVGHWCSVPTINTEVKRMCIFHPIGIFKQDTIRIWHANTYRLVKPSTTGKGACLAVAYLKGATILAFCYDEARLPLNLVVRSSCRMEYERQIIGHDIGTEIQMSNIKER